MSQLRYLQTRSITVFVRSLRRGKIVRNPGSSIKPTRFPDARLRQDSSRPSIYCCKAGTVSRASGVHAARVTDQICARANAVLWPATTGAAPSYDRLKLLSISKRRPPAPATFHLAVTRLPISVPSVIFNYHYSNGPRVRAWYWLRRGFVAR